MIKSTVIQELLRSFHQQYPHLKIALLGILVERRRLEDFANQDILVCGTHHQDVAELIFQHHQEAGVLRTPNFFHVTLHKRN